jgi:hypothetical protein
MTFDEYVSGKRVCIIGASDSLTKQKQADLINSYDVVCRVNWGYPIADELVEYTGKRCDVLYHLMKIGIASDKDFMRRAVADGVKWIVSALPEDNPAYKRFHSLCGDIVPHRAISKEMRVKLRDAIGGSPNTGQIAIRDLLSFNIKELYITGFDFYTGLYHANYGPHAPDASKKRPMQHDQVKQFRLFIDLCQKDKRITYDDTLRVLVDARSLLDEAVKGFDGRGIELCGRGAALYRGRLTVIEERMRSDVRRDLGNVAWGDYSFVVVHDTKYANIYHKYIRDAREINKNLKIIIELKTDKDVRFAWRVSDRTHSRPDVKMNVAII